MFHQSCKEGIYTWRAVSLETLETIVNVMFRYSSYLKIKSDLNTFIPQKVTMICK